MNDTTSPSRLHRIMIVDDDEISSALLATALQDDFDILCAASGEDCLARIDGYRPEVVLLDIVMDGIDGYETCRRLRALDSWPTPAEQPAVIFVSGHDSLDERLMAYESGGDDFMTKPPEATEVRRKVRALVALVAARRQLQAEKDSVQQMAMSFLTNLGESGTALQFLRNGLACDDMAELARLAIGALGEYGLSAHVQLRPPGECLTFADQGIASPLEESVLAQVRGLDRIFQFHNRLVINYPHVSILINNLPIEDEDRCGRLRDHLAIIAEGCEASAVALIRTAEIERRNCKLQAAARAVERTIEALREQYRMQQTETRVILHQMNEQLAKELIYIGLTEKQEDQLQTLLAGSTNEALKLFQRGLEFDTELGKLLTSLAEGD